MLTLGIGSTFADLSLADFAVTILSPAVDNL